MASPSRQPALQDLRNTYHEHSYQVVVSKTAIAKTGSSGTKNGALGLVDRFLAVIRNIQMHGF
jgi:hypothetical protein